jgi:hypothetical protein
MKTVLAVAVVMFGAATQVASAHRLDEYLQAARLSVASDRVDLEMDLTAGASVADDVFASIDADNNTVISMDESREYASRVLASTTLNLDGRAVPMTLTGQRSPQRHEMQEGIGVFQLTASGTIPPLTPGTHQLTFRNTHRPDVSVYLVNALIPQTSAIAIVGQHRDVQQRELTMDIRVSGYAGNWIAAGQIAMVAVVMALPAAMMWRRRRT